MTTGYKLYDILGLQKNAPNEDVKKAYKKQAVKYHPDKGGDPEQFKKISKAYQVLSDPQTRQLYDQLGDKKFEEQESSGGYHHDMHGESMNPFDLFAQFFGGDGGPGGGGFFGGGHPAMHQKKKTIQHIIDVSLDDVYHGIKKRLRISEDISCPLCESICKECNGTGYKTQMLQMGFMTQMVQSQCNACRGTGKVNRSSSSNSSCDKCKGAGSYKDTHTVEVALPAGIETGSNMSIAISSKSDLLLTIKVREHPVFRRAQNNDLLFDAHLTLKESVVGKLIDIPHFDGTIRLDTSTIGIIYHTQQHIIQGKGLPRGNSAASSKANLVVIFSILPVLPSPYSVPSSIQGLFLDAFNKLDQYADHIKSGGKQIDFVG